MTKTPLNLSGFLIRSSGEIHRFSLTEEGLYGSGV